MLGGRPGPISTYLSDFAGRLRSMDGTPNRSSLQSPESGSETESPFQELLLAPFKHKEGYGAIQVVGN